MGMIKSQYNTNKSLINISGKGRGEGLGKEGVVMDWWCSWIRCDVCMKC